MDQPIDMHATENGSTREAPSTTDAATTEPGEAEQTTIAPTEVEKIAVEFSMPGKYEEIVGDNKTAFIDNLQPQLASQLGVKDEQIQNLDVKSGSIITTFDLVPDPSSNVNVQSAVKAMEETAKAGNLTFTTPNGTILSVRADSFKSVVEAKPIRPTVGKADDDLSDGALAGIIVGVILGFLLLITIIALVMNEVKKKKGMIGKIMPESDSDLEAGQEGNYRSLEQSPDNYGYEAGDEGDSPKYQDVEGGVNNNNNVNEYQEVGAPTIAPTSSGPPAQVSYEPPPMAAAAPDDSALYETVVPGQANPSPTK